MATVIVYGPPGSGKTIHAEALRQFFNCKFIVDPWYLGQTIKNGGLHLAQERPFSDQVWSMMDHDCHGVNIISIEKAILQLKSGGSTLG